MEYMNGQMGTDMKENGNIVSDMAKEMTSFRMEIHTWESMSMEKQMAMGSISGQTETSTLVFSWKV